MQGCQKRMLRFSLVYLFLQPIVGFCFFDVNPLEEMSFTRKIFLNNLPWNISKRTPFSNYVNNAMGLQRE
jgi:hypothetical protein